MNVKNKKSERKRNENCFVLVIYYFAKKYDVKRLKYYCVLSCTIESA